MAPASMSLRFRATRIVLIIIFVAFSLLFITSVYNIRIMSSSDSQDPERNHANHNMKSLYLMERNRSETLAARLEAVESELLAIKGMLDKKIAIARSRKTFPDVRFQNEKARKRILVTGGAGFVGSHLVDRLMMDGHECTLSMFFFFLSACGAVVRGALRRTRGQWLDLALMAHQAIHPSGVGKLVPDRCILVSKIFQSSLIDLTNDIFMSLLSITTLLGESGTLNSGLDIRILSLFIMIWLIRILLKLIRSIIWRSPASPPHYMYNPVKTIKTNILGTINMLGLAKLAIFLIHKTKVHPQPETYWGHVNTIGPRSCYDEGKRVAESLMVAYNKQEHVSIRIARIFNTFGPRMHMSDGRVVSNFIIQALQGSPITIYGDGTQTRSFQYIDDLIDGLISLMNSNCSLPVNLGNTEEHSIKDFAYIIRDLVGSSSEIVNQESQEDDPQQRKPDISRAAKELNWKPKVPMLEGLKKTIEYFRQEMNGNRRLSDDL
ncbi:hypothetical protein KIN20_003591 [Parelaphostrongylus tenuis]|uniref:UDP-glucuronate decarboxylase n=1 Tax=Parelaphostrongylus tenuis TaxID=148309 RepID=A0AAD5LXJ1_PARTN|nr:hypothetical protein KIN20_003591 [Parelaphostrongylus tenuis]